MSREIKFRAWNKAHKRFAPEKDDYTITMNGVVKDYPPDDMTWNRWEDAKDIVIMQFTGLKDKNGVEIYEGDIVRKDGWSEPKEWRWVVKWLEEHLRFEPMGDFLVNCEVIGNIYETPELLESNNE